MEPRTVEDRLREEYTGLLPALRRAVDELEAEVRYLLIPICGTMEPYERLIVKSRIKECESAIAALCRRQEGKEFNPDNPVRYSLRALNDLVGLRILAFPKSLVLRIDARMCARFYTWTSDPVRGVHATSQPLALKYHGYCREGSTIRCEVQIVPMLIGLFWEVEHAALYKPAWSRSGLPAAAREVQQRNEQVICALEAFEEEFEAVARRPSLLN